MQIFSLSTTALAALCILAGCTPSADEDRARQDTSAQRTFSAEERRIARALSLGGDEVRDRSSPQSYAMLCSIALEAIGARLESGNLLSAEQRQAFTAARRMYSERATAGISRQEQDALRREVEAAYPETGDRARLGIGCVRSLTGA